MVVESEDENILPSLWKDITTVGDEVSFLPSIGDELAAHHRHHRILGDDCLLPAQQPIADI